MKRLAHGIGNRVTLVDQCDLEWVCLDFPGNRRVNVLPTATVQGWKLEAIVPAALIASVAVCLSGCGPSVRNWKDIDASRRTWKELALPEPDEFDYALGEVAGDGAKWRLTHEDLSAVLKSLRERKQWNAGLPRNNVYHPPREALCTFQFVSSDGGAMFVEVRHRPCVSVDAGLFVVPEKDYERIVAVCKSKGKGIDE